MAPSQSEAPEDPFLPPLDPATLAKLELDESVVAHVHDLVEEARPLHQDCLFCKRLEKAIADYEERTGEQLPITPRNEP